MAPGSWPLNTAQGEGQPSGPGSTAVGFGPWPVLACHNPHYPRGQPADPAVQGGGVAEAIRGVQQRPCSVPAVTARGGETVSQAFAPLYGNRKPFSSSLHRDSFSEGQESVEVPWALLEPP